MTPGPYVVAYDPKAVKELGRLEKPVVRRIVAAVDELAHQPRPPGSRRLVGHEGLWRIRVGDYRVVYTIRDAELLVLALRIGHRGNVYRQM